MMFLTSTGDGLPCLLNEFISVLQYFGSVLRYFGTCKFGFANSTQYSKFGNVIRNIQNKLGNRALKSDLKLTVIHLLAQLLAYTWLENETSLLNKLRLLHRACTFFYVTMILTMLNA